MPIKSVKMKISKNKKMRFFSCPKDHSTQKLRSQVKRCDLQPVHRRTDTQTHRQTHRVTTEGTLSGFQDFFLQPIIKDRPNINFFFFAHVSDKNNTFVNIFLSPPKNTSKSWLNCIKTGYWPNSTGCYGISVCLRGVKREG